MRGKKERLTENRFLIEKTCVSDEKQTRRDYKDEIQERDGKTGREKQRVRKRERWRELEGG